MKSIFIDIKTFFSFQRLRINTLSRSRALNTSTKPDMNW